MKAKTALLALLLMLMGLVTLSALPLLAQTEEDEEFEFDEPIATDTGAPEPDAAAAAWPVCAWGHWIRSRFPSPPPCTWEHIDDLRGPLAPCSFIKIGGRWYHIVKVTRPFPGRVIITVRPVFFAN